ncbi:MAG: transporter [Sphingobacteriales bacterium UTBCD1]|nr:MAG: transporter [Sphingobacteriales bacterium UTBCD1]
MNHFFVKTLSIYFSKKISLSLLLMMCCSFPVMAQQYTDSILKEPTLTNVIQYALKNQPAVQQSLIDEATTLLQVKSKLADWYPQVNFNYLYQHNFQVQTNIIGGNPVRLGVNNTSALQFSLSQTVFNRDVLLARQTKNIVLKQSKQQSDNTKIDLVVAVSKTFYDLLTTIQQIKVADQNIDLLQQSLKDAVAQYHAGIVDKTDYKRATIALNNAIATKKVNSEALLAKTDNLKALINYPRGVELNIVFDSSRLENEFALDTLQGVDYTRRIEYQILETQKKLQEANMQYNKWSYIPSLTANGAYNLNYLNNNFSKLYSQSFPNSYAGLTLSFPIFEGGKRKYNIQQSEWQLKRTDLDIVNFKNQVNSEYSAAMANYKSSLSFFLTMKENVSLAQEVFDVIRLQYRSGVKAYLDLIVSETDLRTAQINYFDALFQVISSKIDVEKSKGEIRY